MTWYNPLTWFSSNDKHEELPDNKYRIERRTIQEFTAYWPGSNGGHRVYAYDDQLHGYETNLYPTDAATISDDGQLGGPEIDVSQENLTVEAMECYGRWEREIEKEPYRSDYGGVRWRTVGHGDWKRIDD